MTHRKISNAAPRLNIASLLCLFLVSAFCGCAVDNGNVGKNGWISLFNGENVDGWKVKITGYELGDNYGNTFRVADGVLRVSYDQYDKFDGTFGHLF